MICVNSFSLAMIQDDHKWYNQPESLLNQCLKFTIYRFNNTHIEKQKKSGFITYDIYENIICTSNNEFEILASTIIDETKLRKIKTLMANGYNPHPSFFASLITYWSKNLPLESLTKIILCHVEKKVLIHPATHQSLAAILTRAISEPKIYFPVATFFIEKAMNNDLNDYPYNLFGKPLIHYDHITSEYDCIHEENSFRRNSTISKNIIIA